MSKAVPLLCCDNASRRAALAEISSGTSVKTESFPLVAGERNDWLWGLCGDGRDKIYGLSRKFACVKHSVLWQNG